MPSLFARLRSAVTRRKPTPKRNSPKRKTVRRTSPSVKVSGAVGANWYGGRNYLGHKGPLMRKALGM